MLNSLDAPAREELEKVPDTLLAQSSLSTFEPGQKIVQRGQPLEYAFLIIQGEAAVGSLTPDGNTFSWVSLPVGCTVSDLEVLAGHPKYLGDVIAAERCTVLRIPIQAFGEALKQDVVYLYSVATAFARSSFRVSYERGYSAYKMGEDKVMMYVLACCRSMMQHKEFPLRIQETRGQIAAGIGMSVKTVNRGINYLIEQGFISRQGGKITVSKTQYERMDEHWRAIL